MVVRRQSTPPHVRVREHSFEGLNGCIECDYHKDRDGYPVVFDARRGRTIKASRIMLEDKLGRPIMEGYCALHTCDRPVCIAAEHLYEGTLSQNSRDRDQRTGNPCFRGSKHPAAKLNENDVLQIRELLLLGLRQRDVARNFGVTDATIYDIRKGVTWSHVMPKQKSRQVVG